MNDQPSDRLFAVANAILIVALFVIAWQVLGYELVPGGRRPRPRAVRPGLAPRAAGAGAGVSGPGHAQTVAAAAGAAVVGGAFR